MEISEYIQYAFEKFGWHIIFAVIVYYFARPHLKNLAANISRKRANDTRRRETLEKDMKRVRVMQQLDVYRANRQHNLPKDV